MKKKFKKILESLLLIIIAISISFNIYFLVTINKQRVDLNTNKQYEDKIKEDEDALKKQEDEIKKLQDQIKEYQSSIYYKCKYQESASGSFTKTAYLTFDDGPSPLTLQYIDVLNKCNVKGTFFVMGTKAKSNPDIIKAIIDNGNQIGNHTYYHNYDSVYSSSNSFISNIDSAEQIIYDIVGINTRYFRFPGGSSTSKTTSNNIRSYIDILNNKNYVYFDWNVTAGDSGVGSTEATVLYNITSGIQGKDTIVLLMHDTTSSSLQALPEVIRRLKENGFEIKPLTIDAFTAHHHLN